jgi:hypothetical protein
MRPKRQAATRLLQQKTDLQSGNHPKPRRRRKFTPLRRGSLEGFAYTHFADIGHTERIEIGEPAAVIEWVAKCEGIDLIMMPTRSLRNEQYRVTIYIWATNPRRLVRTYFSRH